MPIYEYYCPDNNTVYQFYAKTLAQGNLVPACPANPAFRMEKLVSRFAIQKATGQGGEKPEEGLPEDGASGRGDDPRLEAAMAAMEKEFDSIDENDPKAMGRMMRRMAELTGETLDGEMEEVVRKLEEGTDPEALEEQLGGDGSGAAGDGEPGEAKPGTGEEAGAANKSAKAARLLRRRARAEPLRDPNLYDY